MKNDQGETANIGIYMDEDMIGPCKLMIQEDGTELGPCGRSPLQPSWLTHCSLDTGNL